MRHVLRPVPQMQRRQGGSVARANGHAVIMTFLSLMVHGLAPIPEETAAAYAAPPMDGLILWLDAQDRDTLRLEGERVAAWISKAPGGRVALTSSETQRPRLVETKDRGPALAIQFDGRNDVVRTRPFSRRTRTWTLIAVVAPLRPAKGAIASACATGGNDYDSGFTVDLYGSTSQFEYLSVEGAGRQGGRLNQRSHASPFGPFTLVVVTRDGTEIRLHVDGVLEGARPVSPAETVMDEIRIGARYYGGREVEFLKGEIAETLLYDRALSDAELTAIETGRIASAIEREAGEEYGLAMGRKADEARMVSPRVAEMWPSTAAYAKAREAGETEPGPPLPLKELPIRGDLLESIRLCMHCLNSSFDANRDDEPFFYSNCRVDGTGEFHHALHIGVPHVTGRCLLGNMAASLATGLAFPPDGLAVLTRYLKSSFDNPDHLNSYHDPDKGGRRGLEFHNMREGLYGLWALMHTKEGDWARDKAAKMLRTLDRITDDSGRWSQALVQEAGMAERCQGLSVPNAARMVDPLLAVHRITGDPVALKLAGQYARVGLEAMFTPDGHFAPMDRSSGHVHSITSSLSGITEFAVMTGDRGMIEACRRIIDVGVPQYFSSWGWGDEVFPDHPADEVSRGEINQTGDVVRAALHLGAAGDARYYELAERFLRSMLLPTQHREEELRRFMRDNEAPTRDAERDVIRRSVGGYSMQLPNDRMAEGDWPIQTQDITSGAVHALAECWRHRTTLAGRRADVNLLFDYEGDVLSVASALPLTGRIAIRARRPLNLRIRVPEWVDEDTVEVTANGAPCAAVINGGYLLLDGVGPGDRAVVRFHVPCRIERETVDGTEYTTTWVGNQMVDIRPRGTVSPLPF